MRTPIFKIQVNKKSPQLSQTLLDRLKATYNISNPNTATEQVKTQDEDILPVMENISSTGDDQQDLALKIKKTEAELAGTALDDPNRAVWLKRLGFMLRSRYDQVRDSLDLGPAIKNLELALAATPLDDPERSKIMESLGAMLSSKYDQSGELQDLGLAIKQAEVAVASITSDDPNRAAVLKNHCFMLRSRYDRVGDPLDLEQAITKSKEALTAITPGDSYKVRILGNLSAMLSARYDRSGDLQDLELAIVQCELALAAMNSDDPNRGSILANLGVMFGTRYNGSGVLQDIGLAIKKSEEALAATTPDKPNQATILGNLGSMHHIRYNQSGDLQDLELAIKYSEGALAALALNATRQSEVARYLGIMLNTRYDRLGELQDLEQAIKNHKLALAATPPIGSELSARLEGATLNRIYDQRYWWCAALEGNEQAIKWAEVAAAVLPPTHSRHWILNDLRAGLFTRYRRIGNVQDLEQSIGWGIKALEATPPDHSQRAKLLHNLSICYHVRYERLRDLGDLKKAINSDEEALGEIPADDPFRRTLLANLCLMIKDRYQNLGDQLDLDLAIRRGEECIAATPAHHLHQINHLVNLARALNLRYLQKKSIQDFHYILRIYYEAWYCHTSSPKKRIEVAYEAAALFATKNMWQDSSFLLENAVKILPRVSSRSFERYDQDYHLSGFMGLASVAVSTAFQAGEEAGHCLRLLEFGRGIITGFVIDPSGLSELQLGHPEMFDKFRRLRGEIDYSLVGLGIGEDNHGLVSQQKRNRREQAVQELEETLVLIRELPGFEGFQLLPRYDDLTAMAVEGPILIFNSTKFRSDAIIVTKAGTKALALPKLLYSDVERWMGEKPKLIRGKHATYHLRNAGMRELLQWLWDVAVEPVFRALQIDPVNDDSNLPRVWWIGVGLLAMAPFHAAGDHSPGSTDNTLSRAISSYTPTIKALSSARQKKLDFLSNPHSRILLITMPTTPEKGWVPLEKTAPEVDDIVALVDGKTKLTIMDRPSTAQVLRQLLSHDIAHFACHGVSDAENPSNSSLLLRRDNGMKVDRLSVGMISDINIDRAKIAYLSACSTTGDSSKQLADEPTCIASGLQLAGFSHVLATQWIARDSACRQVANDFYSALFDGRGCGGHQKVSASFHSAVKKLRDENWKQPIFWASFIHTGA